MNRIVKYTSEHLQSKIKLLTHPSTSLVTDRIDIKGEGLQPNSKYTIESSLRCETEGFDFSSHAHVISNGNGAFNLTKTPSLGGTYQGIDGMGLFWSMKSHNSRRFQMLNATNKLPYKLNLYNDHINSFTDYTPLTTSKFKRSILKDGVQREEINVNGLIGTLFSPEGKGPFPAVITITGANKEKHVVEDYASLLANRGFVTLALAFFEVEGLPRRYDTQPIDISYFENAAEYLQSLDHVLEDHIGVFGSSKGGELSFAMMSFLSQLKFVCILNGFPCCCLGSDVAYKNNLIAKSNMNLRNVKVKDNMVVNTKDIFDKKDLQDSQYQYQIQNSDADSLFIYGEDDKTLSSSFFASIIEQKAKDFNLTNFQVKQYKGVGHLIDLPYTPIVTKDRHFFAPKGTTVDFGGSEDLSAYSKGLDHIWDDVFDFFDRQQDQSLHVVTQEKIRSMN